MTLEWKNTDPRYDINKRAKIIILRPSEFGHNRKEVALANVDTKEVWCIFTDFYNTSCISADDKWDDSWFWIFAPNE
jgi:hypothetical protein